MKVDFSKVAMIEVRDGGQHVIINYKSGQRRGVTFGEGELGLGDLIVSARKAGVNIVGLEAPKPMVLVVQPDGKPVELAGATMIKVYPKGGRLQVNVQKGARGLIALLASGLDAVGLANALGWRCVPAGTYWKVMPA